MAEQIDGTIAVLNVGGMHDNVQQEAHRVDQDVPLATLDLLAGVERAALKTRRTARGRLSKTSNSSNEPRQRSPGSRSLVISCR